MGWKRTSRMDSLALVLGTPAAGILLGLVLAATPFSPTVADELVLEPVRDNTLFLDPEGALSSGAGPALFVGNNSQMNARRSVLLFDLSVLPAEATIEAAALLLEVTNVPGAEPVEVTMHRVLAPWGEGVSVSNGGGGAPSAQGDATWIHRFFPDSTWAEPGGDFLAMPSATMTLGSEGSYTVGGGGLREDVSAWVRGDAPNHGWILVGAENAPQTARGIASREAPDEDSRPHLTVTYTPVSPVLETSWGQIKARILDR